MRRMPLQIEEPLRRVVAESGIVGDPSRFEVIGPEPRRGTIHPLPKEHAGKFPLPVAVMVVKIDGDEAVVCPIVVPPFHDSTILAGDRWLLSDDSPFRLLPGTGEMLSRGDWTARIPIAGMEPAVRIIDLAALVAVPPESRGRKTPDSPDVPDWSGIWQEVIAAMQ